MRLNIFSNITATAINAVLFLLYLLLQAWHTYKGFHAMPIYLNSLNNAILRANLPDNFTNHSQYGMYSRPQLYVCVTTLELKRCFVLQSPYCTMCYTDTICVTGVVTISHPFRTTWIQKLRYAL